MTDEELAGWARSWHWADTAEDKPVDPSIYFRDMRMLKAFVSALDGHRAAEKRKNCKHTNKLGSGSLGSDGSSETRWWCRDCGTSYSEKTEARPRAEPPAILMNGVVGSTGESQ